MAKKILRRSGVRIGASTFRPGQEKEFAEAAEAAGVNLTRLEMAGDVEGFADVPSDAEEKPKAAPKKKTKRAKKKR